MKPRRPTVKDSTQRLHGFGAKRKSQQVAARAARKAAAKKAKLEASESRRDDVSQGVAEIVQDATQPN
jgi:hypothetical protein